MSYVAVGVALVTAAAGYVNQRQVAAKQDRTAAQNIRTQTALQGQANQKTNQLIDQVTNSSPAAAQKSLMDAYTQELNSKRALSNSNLNQVGNVSDAYRKAANDAAQGISTYGNTTAGLLSAIDAPGLQRQGETSDLSQYASALGGISQASRDATGIEQLQLAGIQPNPWLSALSQAGSAFSRTYSPGGTAAAGGTGGGFNGATGTGTYTGTGSTATTWPGMNSVWGR